MRRIAAAALSVLLLAGCASESARPLKVGMVLDTGGLGDRSFNDAAYAGLGRCVVRDNVDPTALQSTGTTDYAAELASLNGDDAIIAIGFMMQDALQKRAVATPATRYAIVDAVVDAPNVTSITFREEEGSFLAGAIAGATTKSRKVAFVGGIDSPVLRRFESGFAAGAKQAGRNVNVQVRYLGSFSDLDVGRRTADALYAGGVDIIFAAAGAGGIGVINEARRRHKYAIGVDADQDGLAPGTVLTSVRKRIDVAVERICADAAAHRPAGGHMTLGLAQDGVALTDFRYARSIVPASALRANDELRAAIISGRLKVPSTREDLARFTPIAL